MTPTGETRGKAPILLAVDLYPDGGGISAIVENVVQALGSRYEVHVAIMDEREGRAESLPLPEERIHTLGTRQPIKPYLAPTSLIYPLRVGWFLRGLVRRIRPAALLVQDGLFLPVPGLLATRGGDTKLVIMDHGTLTNSLDRRWQRSFPSQLTFPKSVVFRTGFAVDRPWRELRWRLGFTHADAVWYVGEEMKPLLARAGARARQYRQPMPKEFRPPEPEERRQLRSSFGLPDQAVVVNMVTRFDFEKGLSDVVEAVQHILPRHPNLRLLMAGHGAGEGWLREELTRRGLVSSVTLLGKLGRKDVQRLHHASDFHLYAGTLGCGMSLALLEALACGVVPIVSDTPAQHREVASESGWVFPAGDAAALAEALDAALSCGPDELAKRRRRAVESAEAYARPSVLEMVDDLLAPRSSRYSALPSS